MIATCAHLYQNKFQLKFKFTLSYISYAFSLIHFSLFSCLPLIQFAPVTVYLSFLKQTNKITKTNNKKNLACFLPWDLGWRTWFACLDPLYFSAFLCALSMIPEPSSFWWFQPKGIIRRGCQKGGEQSPYIFTLTPSLWDHCEQAEFLNQKLVESLWGT